MAITAVTGFLAASLRSVYTLPWLSLARGRMVRQAGSSFLSVRLRTRSAAILFIELPSLKAQGAQSDFTGRWNQSTSSFRGSWVSVIHPSMYASPSSAALASLAPHHLLTGVKGLNWVYLVPYNALSRTASILTSLGGFPAVRHACFQAQKGCKNTLVIGQAAGIAFLERIRRCALLRP